MATKVQSQLLVTPITRDRADAVALVLGVSRAEVYRMALDGAGVAGLEETYADQLKDLDAVAAGMKLSRLDLARRAAEDKYSLDQLRGRKRYPVRTAE